MQQYAEAHCAPCGGWRTALVGYSGERICLTCGGAIGSSRPASTLAPLSGATWVDAAWTDAPDLGPERRKERLRGWLGMNGGVALPEEVLEVLALCDRASELRFALPIVTLSTWVPVGERSFSDGNWTLRVKQPVLEHRADFVLEGRGGVRPIVVEIAASGPDDPERRRREHLRTLRLMAEGYGIIRVPGDRAEERGVAFRKVFMRESVRVLEQAPAGPAVEVARPRRLWARHELVYDASGLPIEERRELVEDWLRSRGEALEGWQLDFLAHCDRAAEVHFALPLLRLPDAEPVDPRTVHLGPWHTLQAQLPVDGEPVDFAFTTMLAESRELVATLIEIHPARGPRDPRAEADRLRRWREAGHEVVAMAAPEARARGEGWARSLLREIRWRGAQEAG